MVELSPETAASLKMRDDLKTVNSHWNEYNYGPLGSAKETLNNINKIKASVKNNKEIAYQVIIAEMDYFHPEAIKRQVLDRVRPHYEKYRRRPFGLDSLNSGSSGSPCGSPSSTLSPTLGGAHSPNTFSYSPSELTDVMIIGSRWSSNRFWCFGLTLEEVIAEDGKKWVFIKRIVPRSAADRSLCVQLDVIHSVNNQGVKYKSKERVRQLIMEAGENLLLKVVTHNPIRLAKTRRDMLNLIDRCGTVTLEAYGNQSYCGLHVDVGFKILSTLTYSEEQKKFVTLYFISEVDGRRYTDLSQKQCLFIGDVLLSVNSSSVIDLSKGDVNRLMREFDRFTIKVAAMSALRREVVKEDIHVKRRKLEVGDLSEESILGNTTATTMIVNNSQLNHTNSAAQDEVEVQIHNGLTPAEVKPFR